MTLANKRLLNFAGFLVCVSMMGFALYAQYGLMLEPCPLCVFQRIATILLGLVFLIAALHNPGKLGSRIYAVLIALAAGDGVAIASRHVYLQNLPADRVPACGPGFEYIMENFALFDALDLIFQGSGECAEVVWRLFGLSMPTWVIIGLGGLGIAGVWNNLRKA
ncbi:MAG: disulfide bond formation protein B [Gammaproteobacteria bacterium]|nr:disulfide bond formation protein B [Gammaproteobacteria bacterium]MDH3363878.1 disulfide bond formation protein B [Gammaproteobacteria bacterium]MDH3481931.1 disulfide bond formation protein B [Gammaproteobacteria bacterium]